MERIRKGTDKQRDKLKKKQARRKKIRRIENQKN
jgi:hypothetical protein